ncbi:hypothetical protein PRK78_000292 [Emydomyces testavorans]|uniref:Uncharacterized protein n=1 Tax=Emydomyces testavorans TaxID=2070801 RepID=A0AAF0IFP4_9EURO|nr:hypothetical protein PRK78_000292 [Emydomyces testavorans]
MGLNNNAQTLRIAAPAARPIGANHPFHYANRVQPTPRAANPMPTILMQVTPMASAVRAAAPPPSRGVFIGVFVPPPGGRGRGVPAPSAVAPSRGDSQGGGCGNGSPTKHLAKPLRVADCAQHTQKQNLIKNKKDQFTDKTFEKAN